MSGLEIDSLVRKRLLSTLLWLLMYPKPYKIVIILMFHIKEKFWLHNLSPKKTLILMLILKILNFGGLMELDSLLFTILLYKSKTKIMKLLTPEKSLMVSEV